MNSIRVSAAARSDLNEIWLYIAEGDLVAADRLIEQVVSRFPKLAAWSEIGRERAELSPRLRSLVVGRYVIFYRPMENGIEVVRVLHGARDLPPLFE
jgi:toxin ParE1/3/4